MLTNVLGPSIFNSFKPIISLSVLEGQIIEHYTWSHGYGRGYVLANLLGPTKPIISLTVLEGLIVEHESGIIYTTINERTVGIECHAIYIHKKNWN